MRETATKAASDSNAKQSRQSEVRTCAANRARRRRSWLRPFRRTHQSVNHSLRLIEKSGRVIEAAERFAARRPLRAVRKYERVSGWIEEATKELSSAVRDLRMTAEKIALSPTQASDAPPLLLETAARWVGAAGKLAALSDRLDDTFDLIIDAVETGATLDLSRLCSNPIVPARKVIRLRPLPPRRPPCNSARIRVIHSRRRRSPHLTFANVARRIFRGRAPPLSSTCPL